MKGFNKMEDRMQNSEVSSQKKNDNLIEKINQYSWYHKIQLPGGIITPGWAPIDASRYCIPEDMTGLRVLDIGAWDGYWTWEALKRGASEVVAIDDFSDTCGNPDYVRNGWDTFDIAREAFGFTIPEVINGDEFGSWNNDKGQMVKRINHSIYDIPHPYLMPENPFDIVFFFGTIYHLKHPLLALEKISQVCEGSIYIETASLDEYSPYRGGIGSGFNRNEMVMEFYPGKEYGNNDSNWWAPTLQCLGAMMESVGFQNVECWPLTEIPKDLSQCRGFASGTKDPQEHPAYHPAEITTQISSGMGQMKVAAVMSVPRLGFMDNSTCCQQAMFALRIPVINVQGAFWGQCLERGMQQIIDAGYEVIVTIDYDTIFSKTDVEDILRLLYIHPEAAAVVPVQRGRGGFPVLMSMKTASGQVRKDVPLTELLEAETVKIASGHFGLTALRVKDLLDIPHPWFQAQPNNDGQWGPGRVDDDIYFWKKLEAYKKTVLLANRIPVGHLELMAKWPGKDMQPVYQNTGEFHDKGRPENVWR